MTKKTSIVAIPTRTIKIASKSPVGMGLEAEVVGPQTLSFKIILSLMEKIRLGVWNKAQTLLAYD